MDDGKPLVLSILERNGTLFLAFVKTGEGLWAEGAGIVCTNGSDVEARFVNEEVRTGPAANWATRYALTNGAQFTLTKLGSQQLRIATAGWSGTFACRR